VYFAANDETTAKYVSNHLGTKTIQTASRSDPGGFRWATKTTGHSGRDLMLPEQVRQLKDTKEIVFKEGARPIKANKIRYYRDKAFKRRILPPAPVPRLKLKPVGPRDFDSAMSAGSHITAGGDSTVSAERAAESEANAVTEIEAMGREIARLVSNELTSSGDQAVADLNAILEQSAER
jgi:type IV secretion system protein VirD4